MYTLYRIIFSWFYLYLNFIKNLYYFWLWCSFSGAIHDTRREEHNLFFKTLPVPSRFLWQKWKFFTLGISTMSVWSEGALAWTQNRTAVLGAFAHSRIHAIKRERATPIVSARCQTIKRWTHAKKRCAACTASTSPIIISPCPSHNTKRQQVNN